MGDIDSTKIKKTVPLKVHIAGGHSLFRMGLHSDHDFKMDKDVFKITQKSKPRLAICDVEQFLEQLGDIRSEEQSVDLIVLDVGSEDIFHMSDDDSPENEAGALYQLACDLVRSGRTQYVILCAVLWRGQVGDNADPSGEYNQYVDLFNAKLENLAKKNPEVFYWEHEKLVQQRVIHGKYLCRNGYNLTKPGLALVYESYLEAIKMWEGEYQKTVCLKTNDY